MKRHLDWLHVAATAAIVAGSGLPHAIAQYAPYRPTPKIAPTSVAAQQPVAPTTQSAYAPYRPQGLQYRSAMSPYGQTAGYPQTAAAYPQTATAYPQTATRYPTTRGFLRIAQQPTETLPAPSPSESLVTPSAPMNGEAAANGAAVPSTTTMPNGYETGAPAYVNGGMSGYPSTGCDENVSGYGYGGGHYSDYGLGGYFDNPHHDSQWFGGVYFLWMERDNASPVKLTVEVDHDAVTEPYYPPADTTVVATHQTDHDFRAGVEFRIGSTFTAGSHHGSGYGHACGSGYGYGYGGYGHGCEQPCEPCGGDVYAWEFVWWALDDDAQVYTFDDEIPTDNVRIYGMRNFVGLEYDRDAGATFAYRPVNEYYGYSLPIGDPDVIDPLPRDDGYLLVLAQRVRTNFEASNLELNLFHFPMCDIGCSGGYTGCDAGGCSDYGYGYGVSGCEDHGISSAFSMYGSCGVRYFRIDDDFMYANEFTEWAGGAPDKPAYDGFNNDESNELYYDIQVENHLIGAQLGWTLNYCVACKWNFFCSSTFGVYDNRIDHYQRMYTGGDGDIRFTGDGRTFSVSSDKEDIAFLGELRLGGSYDVTCHWRLAAAYRAVAIAGLATSTDQIKDDFTNYEYVQLIDSDQSMVVHGFQVGAEFRY